MRAKYKAALQAYGQNVGFFNREPKCYIALDHVKHDKLTARKEWRCDSLLSAYMMAGCMRTRRSCYLGYIFEDGSNVRRLVVGYRNRLLRQHVERHNVSSIGIRCGSSLPVF